MNMLLDLFLSFAKIGLFTFGGGYAMIALIGEAALANVKKPENSLEFPGFSYFPLSISDFAEN